MASLVSSSTSVYWVRLSVLNNVVVMFIIIARAPCGAVRCTVLRLKVLLSIEDVRQLLFSRALFYSR